MSIPIETYLCYDGVGGTDMPDEGYRPPDGYLTTAGAMARLGVSKATLWRIVRRGELPTYRDPRDRRVRLVKVAEVERLEQPVPEGESSA